MTRQMTDDEVTVLEVIMYLQEKDRVSFLKDIEDYCSLSQKEISIAIDSLQAEKKVSLSLAGWVTA